jgi:type I restriction enzyme S subunit
MSSIEKLIVEYCPEGVNFKTLSDLFEIRNGYTPSKANSTNWTDGTIPWFRMEDIRENGHILDDAKQHIPVSALKGGRLFPANTIIIATSATIGEHALITVPFMSNQRFTAMWPKPEYISKFDTKFIFYYCYLLDEWCRNNITKSSFAAVDMTGFKRFKFPVLPLIVQQEIASTLDKFASLEAELEAELEARQKQYEFYRNQLLSFDNLGGVRWTTLGEVAMYSKSRIKATKLHQDNYVGVDNMIQNRQGKTFSSHVPTIGNLTQFDTGDVLIGNIRPYLKKVWHADKTGGTNGDVLVMKLKSKEVTPRYLYQVLSADKFFEYEMQHAKGAKMPRGDKASILQYPVPIPPIDAQERIVGILDKFDSFVHDISEGLPAEITARRKQYEHYRSKLLSFQELPA